MATTKRRSEPSTELEGTKKKFKSGEEIKLFLGVVENFKSDKQGEDWLGICNDKTRAHSRYIF